MNKWVLFFSLFFGLSAASQANSHQAFDENFWTGHLARGDLGFIVDYGKRNRTSTENTPGVFLSDPGKTKVMLRGNATAFLGYEYGRQFARNWYWSAGLTWTIAYPRNFTLGSNTERAKNKRLIAWLQPLTNARIGYVFENQSLLNLGLVYLWGLSLNYRIPLSKSLFFETEYLQWLDGILGLEKLAPTLAAAFDFSHFAVGFGWKF